MSQLTPVAEQVDQSRYFIKDEQGRDYFYVFLKKENGGFFKGTLEK